MELYSFTLDCIGLYLDKTKIAMDYQTVDVFWAAIKAAVITSIILILLQLIPIRVGVNQTGYRWDVGVSQSDHVWSISR